MKNKKKWITLLTMAVVAVAIAVWYSSFVKRNVKSNLQNNDYAIPQISFQNSLPVVAQ